MKDPTPQDVADALDRLADLVADGALPIPDHIDIGGTRARANRSTITATIYLNDLDVDLSSAWLAQIPSACDVTLPARVNDRVYPLVLHARTGPIHLVVRPAHETVRGWAVLDRLPLAQFDPDGTTCAKCGANNAWTLVADDGTVLDVDCALDFAAADPDTADTEAVSA